MSFVSRLMLLLAAASLLSSSALAIADEPQAVIPLDARVGAEIERAERDKFQLFGGVPGFVRAYVLEAGDGYELHLVYDRDGKRYLEVRPFDSSEFDALRTAIASAREPGGNGDGRLRLVFHGTLYGAFLYGGQMSELLDVDEDRYQVGMFMLGTGAGFGAAMAATRAYDQGGGFAKMLTTGSYVGLYFGMLPELWNDEARRIAVDDHGYEYEVERIPRLGIVGAMIGVPAGTLAMGAISKNRDVTDGEADATLYGSLAGVAYGFAGAYLAGAEQKTGVTQKRMYLSSTAALIPVGGFLGYRFAHSKALSSGRVALLGLGGIVGAYSGASFVRMLDGDDVADSKKPYVWAMSAAFPLGLAQMYRATSDQTYSRGRAGIVTVGTIAGGLLGAGIVYVATNSDDSRPYLLASAASSIATFAIAHRSTRTMTAANATDRAIGSAPAFEAIGATGAIAALQQGTRANDALRVIEPSSSGAWQFANPSEILTAVALARSGVDAPPVRLVTARF